MKRIGFDHASGTLVVMGGEIYPARALSVVPDVAGMVRIVSASGRVEVYEHWTRIGPLDCPDGFCFADEAQALAYLHSAFTQHASPDAPGWTAARPLSAPRAVRDLGDGRVDYASADDPDALADVLGVTASASAEGAAADLVTAGPIVCVGWGLVPGEPLILGRDGVVLQAPFSGARRLIRLGLALTPDTALVRIGPAITLL